MGFKDLIKNVTDLAKDSYETIQSDIALKQEEQQRLRDEMNTRINAYTEDLIDRLLENTFSINTPFIKADSDSLVSFTKAFTRKLLLPGNTSASKIVMHPYEEKILNNIQKTFPNYLLSEYFLFQFKDSKGQLILVTTSNIYFKVSLPDRPSFYSTGSIPKEKVFELNIKWHNEECEIQVNKIPLISTPKTEVHKFDYVTLSDYFNRIKNSDFIITDDQIDAVTRSKLDNNVLEILQKYISEEENLIYFAWGGNSMTAKDFVVCTNKQILMLSRELSKPIKQFTYENITAISTQMETVEFLDFSLTVGMNPNKILIHALGTNDSINILYSREAEHVVQIYQQYKKGFYREEQQAEDINPEPTTPKESPLELLEKLAVLKEKGIISEDEFNQKKEELLAKL